MTNEKKDLVPFEEAEEGALAAEPEMAVGDMVKLSILKSAGRTNGPEDLSEATPLGTLISRPEQLVLLRVYLSNIITHFKQGAIISVSQIEACSSVGEVVDLVKGIIR